MVKVINEPKICIEISPSTAVNLLIRLNQGPEYVIKEKQNVSFTVENEIIEQGEEGIELLWDELKPALLNLNVIK